ncbi:hypothetical protein HG530_001549 [Fusarium avenaceum]|nr:hypothetical protein HG530_001549 [Fusarium avenaceum]
MMDSQNQVVCLNGALDNQWLLVCSVVAIARLNDKQVPEVASNGNRMPKTLDVLKTGMLMGNDLSCLLVKSIQEVANCSTSVDLDSPGYCTHISTGRVDNGITSQYASIAIRDRADIGTGFKVAEVLPLDLMWGKDGLVGLEGLSVHDAGSQDVDVINSPLPCHLETIDVDA